MMVNLGLSPEKIDALNWQSFIINNLVPVTIGNVIGGVLLVGGVYWFVYLRDKKEQVCEKMAK